MDSIDNPYQAPVTQAPHTTPESRALDAQPDSGMTRYAQMFLRLLGVMFVIEGIAGIAGSLVYGGVQSYSLRVLGNEPASDEYMFSWFVSSAILLFAGMYLVVGGHWVLEKVFLPVSSHLTSQTEDEAKTSTPVRE